MTPLALPSAVQLVASSAKELLDAHIAGKNVPWIVQTALVVEALKRTKGNKCQAARLLGVHRNTVLRYTDKFFLDAFVKDVKKSSARQFNLALRKARGAAA